MKPQYEFEFLTSDNKVVKWHGETWEEAARAAANCLKIEIVAWRTPRYELLIGMPSIIE